MKKLFALIKKLYYDKRIRFLFVGGLNTVLGFGTYALFILLGWHQIPAQIVSTAIGTVHSYFWNKYFTFRQKKKSVAETVRFVIVYLVIFFVNMGLLQLLVEVAGIGKLISGAICTVFTMLLSFFGHNFFSFKQKQEKLMTVRLSDYIADFLVENGITDVFTVPGGGAMFLNDSFGRNPGLSCTYNHHEQASAMAAEGYARASDKLPAVCVTSGPGGTNALTGVLGSWMDSIPMFVISGQVKFSVTIKSTNVPLRQLGDQEFNIVDCVKTMTKYSVMVTEPETIKYHLKKALYLATHGRKGPVWLDIPINVQSAKIDINKLIDYNENEDKNETSPALKDEDITQLIARLERASRPVILAGEAITITNQKTEFLKLVEKLKIPVVTAWNAHDILGDDNPYYCGRPGTVGTRGGNFVVQNSDFVLSLGCRMNIRQISFNYENFAKGAFLAAVDIDRGELDKPTLNVALKIHADIIDVLARLNSSEIRIKNDTAEWLKWAREVNEKYPAVLNEYYKKKSPINPYVFMKELSLKLRPDEVVPTANGSACVCAFQAMAIKQGQRIFTNSGSASMGYGLPAAIGAAVSLKGKRVVCLEGDGSIQMNIQELQTVRHNDLKIKIIWLNNDGYHSMRQTQTNIFNSFFCGVNKDSGISFPEAEKIAAAYGFKYIRIDSLDVMAEKIDKLLADDEAVICEVILDKEQFFAPKLSAKTLEDGTIVSPPLEDMYPFLPEEEFKNASFKIKGEKRNS